MTMLPQPIRCLAIALMLLPMARGGPAQEAHEAIPPLLTIRYQLTGESEDALLKEATMRAIRSAVGRAYLTDQMLRARDLIDPYIGKHWEKFKARHKINVSEVRGGRRFLDVEVAVDTTKIYADLAEKRFLYKPALRPIFYIFLSETFDGAKAPASGRRRLLEIINERQYRYLWDGGADDPSIPIDQKEEIRLSVPSPDADAGRDAKALAEACREAQRNEIEIFVTGTVETKVTRTAPLYFDDYAFVETRCVLRLVRADTREILASGEITRIAGHVDKNEALKTATLAAVNELVPQILATYEKEWAKTILRKANLRIMVVGAKPKTLALLRQVFLGLDPSIEVYTRSHYADVAVLTLSWSGKTEKLLDLLSDTAHPDLSLKQVSPDALIIELL